MNNSIVVTEVVANQGQACAFKTSDQTLGVARFAADSGLWNLRLQCGAEHLCEDFDEMRMLIRQLAPSGHACFERRRILARRRALSEMAA